MTSMVPYVSICRQPPPRTKLYTSFWTKELVGDSIQEYMHRKVCETASWSNKVFVATSFHTRLTSESASEAAARFSHLASALARTARRLEFEYYYRVYIIFSSQYTQQYGFSALAVWYIVPVRSLVPSDLRYYTVRKAPVRIRV
jgi:hypothetical protein